MADLISAPGLDRAIDVLSDLKQGHERFLNGHSAHPHASYERLEQLVASQHPTAAILSCCDSRVPVELLFDAGFGDLYVVRNAGNACTNATIGSLEYGIGSLGISLLVVMGHEGCGAVTAAYAPQGELTPQLHDLVHTIRAGLDEIEPSLQGDLRAAFRLNAVQAARHLIKGSDLMRQGMAAGTLMLVAAYYTLRRGEIEWLGQLDAGGSLLPI